MLKLSPNLRKQWVCDNLVKKKSAADKEREKANLGNGHHLVIHRRMFHLTMSNYLISKKVTE